MKTSGDTYSPLSREWHSTWVREWRTRPGAAPAAHTHTHIHTHKDITHTHIHTHHTLTLYTHITYRDTQTLHPRITHIDTHTHTHTTRSPWTCAWPGTAGPTAARRARRPRPAGATARAGTPSQELAG